MDRHRRQYRQLSVASPDRGKRMARKSVIGSTIRLLACIAVSAAASASCADAADTIRRGKSVPFAWAFTPVEIGIKEGIWAKNGLDLQVTSFGGDAKLQQAMAA